MKKKMLISILMTAFCIAGNAQNEKEQYLDPVDLAKTITVSEQKELLNKLKNSLLNRNEPKVKWGKMKMGQQFLFKENLIDSILNAKSHNLKDVYAKLREKSNIPTDFNFEELSTENIAYKTFETGKKQGQTDSTTLIVPISFQSHAITKEGLSNVKYQVTFTWEVEVEKETEKIEINGKKINKTIGYTLDGNPKLISSLSKPIKYLSSDKQKMKKSAERAIIEWYANLPQTLDKQYSEKSATAIQALNISPNEIRMALPTSQNFIISDVPTIKINIDPYQFIKDDDRPLYTNPSAYLIIAPKFDISVDNTFNDAKIASVSYIINETIKPIADEEKEKRLNIANAFVNELGHQLSTYILSHSSEQKSYIENMFNAKECDVEVSHLYKSGTEKIKKESAKKYLTHLKGSALNFSINNIEVINPNWDAIVYTINQEYKSTTYSDYTQKKIYLTYDTTKGTYKISKIEVVPNSTKIE